MIQPWRLDMLGQWRSDMNEKNKRSLSKNCKEQRTLHLSTQDTSRYYMPFYKNWQTEALILKTNKLWN